MGVYGNIRLISTVSQESYIIYTLGLSILSILNVYPQIRTHILCFFYDKPQFIKVLFTYIINIKSMLSRTFSELWLVESCMSASFRNLQSLFLVTFFTFKSYILSNAVQYDDVINIIIIICSKNVLKNFIYPYWLNSVF